MRPASPATSPVALPATPPVALPSAPPAAAPAEAFAPEAHRRELLAFCYRMTGGAADAEDAVQEVMLRAHRGAGGFEGRASLRTWLFRIATNVCIDLRKRRLRPADLGPPGDAHAPMPAPEPERDWIDPLPDGAWVDEGWGPERRLLRRQQTRMAFVAALQHLPPHQRAALLLREVVELPTPEVAALLDRSVPATNSLLQRARAALAARPVLAGAAFDADDPAQRAILERYVSAFEAYDMAALAEVLSAEVRLSMPPYALHLQGFEQVRAFFLGHGVGCRSSRLVPVVASGAPAFAQYHPDAEGLHAWSLIVLELGPDRVEGICHFLHTEAVFPRFGLPLRLPR